jgi:hypothetical protein
MSAEMLTSNSTIPLHTPNLDYPYDVVCSLEIRRNLISRFFLKYFIRQLKI